MMPKKRKPRGIKLDGTRSLDMCPYCFSFRCDPSLISNLISIKFKKRLDMGLCPSCGHEVCRCKSKLNR